MKIVILFLVLVCAEYTIRPHSLVKLLMLRGNGSMSSLVVLDENHLLTVLEQTMPHPAFPLSYYTKLSCVHWIGHNVYKFAINPAFTTLLARFKAVPRGLVALCGIVWLGGAVDIVIGHSQISNRCPGFVHALRLEHVSHNWAAFCFAVLAMSTCPVLLLGT